MLSLPPAQEPTPATTAPATDGQGFDVDADVAELRGKQKQDYSDSWTDAEPAAEAKPGPDAGAADQAPQAEAPPDPADKSKAAAREFIEAYDTLQAQGFAAYSDGMKAEKFQLEHFPKERAIHHLARGLEKMGNPELPWWAGLGIALVPAGYLNYLVAREHRLAKEAERAAANKRRAANGEPLSPDSIRDRNGATVPPKTEQPAPAGGGAPPAPASPARAKGPMPLCQECGVNPVKSRKRKYCSTHCAGVATTKLNVQRLAAAKNPTPADEQP